MTFMPRCASENAIDDIIRLVADWSGKPYLFRKIILTLFSPAMRPV
ncbi:MAG: hypothetical protein U5L46_07480 [Agrobacterium sp.]|nr:hypothetical protein [Agrobacterium sp.]